MKLQSCTVGLALLLLLSLSTSIVGLQGQETVHTVFSFENTTFFNISVETKSAVEFRLATILAESAKNRFPFVEWRPAPSGGNQASGHWLVLSMKETTQLIGGRRFYQIDLNYQPPVDEVITLYSLESDKSRQDTSRLISDVERVITRNFGEDAFRRKLEEVLIQKISLADSIILDEREGGEGVLVPVPFAELSPGDSSLLKVDFKADDQRTGIRGRRGEIILTLPRPPREVGLNMTAWWEQRGMRIETETFPDLQGLVDRWSDLRVTSMRVLMMRYIPGGGVREFNDLPSDEDDDIDG